MDTALVVVLTLGAGYISASFFEWVAHKYFMHKSHWFFKYGFETHAKVHHSKFKWDKSYHVQRKEDKKTIHMIRWAPVVITLGSSPYFLVLLASGWFGPEQVRLVIYLGIGISVSYYATYEYLHWCMHLPKARRLEKSRLFQKLNGHHLLHHRYMNKNYNVVLPIADWWMGTLLKRSPVRFTQARGPSVPDVQPLV